MKEDRQDLTTGSIWGKMLLFSIPLVLTGPMSRFSTS